MSTESLRAALDELVRLEEHDSSQPDSILWGTKWEKAWDAARTALAQQADECLRIADAIDPMTRKGLDNLTCAVAAKLLRSIAAPAAQRADEWDEFGLIGSASWQACKEAAKDIERFKTLHEGLEWDGFGYWLPDICVKEEDNPSGDYVPPPTLDEFRLFVDNCTLLRKLQANE